MPAFVFTPRVIIKRQVIERIRDVLSGFFLKTKEKATIIKILTHYNHCICGLRILTYKGITWIFAV